MSKIILLVCIILIISSVPVLGDSVIYWVTEELYINMTRGDEIQQYHLFEVYFDDNKDYEDWNLNVYHSIDNGVVGSDVVIATMHITRPDNVNVSVPGFWYQKYEVIDAGNYYTLGNEPVSIGEPQ